jgi:hypothetical protein
MVGGAVEQFGKVIPMLQSEPGKSLIVLVDIRTSEGIPIPGQFDREVRYFSSNPKVATVSPNGTIAFLKPGKCRITATWRLAGHSMSRKWKQFRVVKAQ